MKSPIKALLVLFAILVGLPILAWTGTFLYWHFRIKSALRSVENEVRERRQATGQIGRGFSPEPDYSTLLNRAGCRALPYLVAGVRNAEERDVYDEMMNYLVHGLAGPRPWSTETEDAHKKRGWAWSPHSPGPGWKEKRSHFLAFWQEYQPRYHQWWRVWSPDCRGAQ